MKKYLKYLISASVFVIAFLAMTAPANATFLYYSFEEPYNVVDTPIDPGIGVTLTASPTSMTLPTNSTTLTWTTSGGVTDCQASNRWTGSKDVRGDSQVISGLTAGTYIYDITCTKAGYANAFASVMVVVNAAIGTPTVRIYANPNPVNIGSSSTISWRVGNSPDICTASDGTNSWTNPADKDHTDGLHSQSSGSISVATRFKITCSKAGFADAIDAVTVNVQDNSKLPKVTISASPNPVDEGTSSSISWEPENADSCWASGGTASWRNPTAKSATGGTQSSDPIYTSTIFSIQCSNTYGLSNMASVAVNVKGKGGCLPPKVIYNGQCIDKCPPGLFLNANRQCVKADLIEI